MAAGLRTARRSTKIAAVAPDDDAEDLTLEQLMAAEVKVICRNGTTETIRVGRIYIDQMLEFATAMADCLDASRLAVAKLGLTLDASMDTSKLIAIFMAMLPAIGPDRASRVLAVLTNRDAKWVRRNADLLTMARIIEAVGEYNPPEQIMAAFSHAVSSWSQKQQTASSANIERLSPAPASPNGTSVDTASNG